MKALDRKDYERARVELERAVEAGHTVARNVLFRIYRDGYGVQRNPKRAYELYLPLAEQGDSSAMVELGDLAIAGAFPIEDAQIARSWYEKAVAKSNAAGYCGLAKLASHATSGPGSPRERARLLQLAAEEQKPSGSKCANQARKELADAYAVGNGVPKDACLSAKYRGALVAHGGGEANWLGAARRAGDPELGATVLAMWVSQYNKAMDSRVGRETFVQAALGDFTGADKTFWLAILHKNGIGVPKDEALAEKLASEAIPQLSEDTMGNGQSFKDWAVSFFARDFSCLRLER
jgi:TPR repeat protein